MQTNFTEEQLRDPVIRRANRILRSCVHCGFCTATCPTYQILGDELDSPRGRIYLIKDMLEKGRPADEKTVLHIDRCLSCLACVTTCPSGVDYMHLVDTARAHIERTYRRPLSDRALRWLLARVLPYPARFRLALSAARMARPFASLIPGTRLRAMLEMAPDRVPPSDGSDTPQVFPAIGVRKMRAALLTGCAQRALNPGINGATIRLLQRLGCEVTVAKGTGCCGALVHHMGKEEESRKAARRNIRAWMAEVRGAGLDAIAINTSGCGTTVKDYGHMLCDDPMAEEAVRISALAMDISELLAKLDYPRTPDKGLKVAYHAACSLRHGQRIERLPKDLLKRAGFPVTEPVDSHLCCGSAGTYNLLQPEIAGKLRDRKVETLEALAPDVIAAGNIGCMMQIAQGTDIPIVHTVELLDWAAGGPKPPVLVSQSSAIRRRELQR